MRARREAHPHRPAWQALGRGDPVADRAPHPAAFLRRRSSPSDDPLPFSAPVNRFKNADAIRAPRFLATLRIKIAFMQHLDVKARVMNHAWKGACSEYCRTAAIARWIWTNWLTTLRVRREPVWRIGPLMPATT